MEVLNVLGLSLAFSVAIGYFGIGVEKGLEEIKKSERATEIASWIILGPLIDKILSTIDVEFRAFGNGTLTLAQFKVRRTPLLLLLLYVGAAILVGVVSFWLLFWMFSGWILKALGYGLLFALVAGAYVLYSRR